MPGCVSSAAEVSVHERPSLAYHRTSTDYMTVIMSVSGPSQAAQEPKARVATAFAAEPMGMSTAACPDAEIAQQTALLQFQASFESNQADDKVVSGLCSEQQLPSGPVKTHLSSPAVSAVARADQEQLDANSGLYRLKIVGIPAGARSSRYDTAVAQDQHQSPKANIVLSVVLSG